MFGAQHTATSLTSSPAAKGLTSGYSPLGAAIISDRFSSRSAQETPPSRTVTRSAAIRCRARSRWPTWTFRAGRTCSATCSRQENAFRKTLEKLYDLPIVGDVRGDGYFYGIELVKDKTTKQTFDAAEVERVLRGYVSGACSRTASTAAPTTAATPSSRSLPR